LRFGKTADADTQRTASRRPGDYTEHDLDVM